MPNKRYIAHVSHLQLVHQLPLDLLYQLDIASNHKEIVHVLCKDDDSIVVVNVEASVGLERNKSDGDKYGICLLYTSPSPRD